MRKLIFAGIITILAVIGWISYLRYDTKKFIEELPQEPPPKQQVNGTKKDSSETLVDGVGETTQARQENTSALPSKEKPKDGAQPDEIGAGTGSDVDALDPEQTPLDTGISPELKKVFTEIRPLYKQMKEIVGEIGTGNNQISKITQRQLEILSEVDSINDDEIERELLEEYNASIKLEQEIGQAVIRLQDELKPFVTELRRILSENGFQSQLEFEKAHIKTYETWESEQ